MPAHQRVPRSSDPGSAVPAETAARREERLPERSGMVAVVGRANVGKSTLVNTLLEEKISIVSPTVQTTRHVVRGVLTDPRAQIVFLDTPGVHPPHSDLGRMMNRAAKIAIQGTDVVMLVMDRSRPPEEEDGGWMRRIAAGGIPCALVLNKSDLKSDRGAAYRAAWELARGEGPAVEAEWFEVSSLRRESLPQLTEFLFARMPEGPLLFPPDMLTDFPRKMNMADVVREKLLRHLYEELPHAVAVWVQDVEDTPAGGWNVSGRIYVQKARQKPIVLGKKGRILKRVQAAAEAELSAMYERPVSLTLHVKVAEGWDRDHWILRRLGHVQ